MSAKLENAYTRDSIPATFVRTALPIVILTSVNGLLTVVDAMFLGAFVGPDALTAVRWCSLSRCCWSRWRQ